MVILQDAFAKRTLMEEIIRRIEKGGTDGVDGLLDAGIPAELLDQIRNCSARDLLAVSEMSDAKFTVTFNSAALLQCFKRLSDMKRKQSLAEYFVREGATPEIMLQLFKLPMSNVRQIRGYLRPTSCNAGRPALNSISNRAEIISFWEELLVREPDIRERYFALHQRFNSYLFSSLWNVVSRYEYGNRASEHIGLNDSRKFGALTKFNTLDA